MTSLPLQTTVLNKHLSELMEGLTAKVGVATANIVSLLPFIVGVPYLQCLKDITGTTRTSNQL